MSIDVSKINPGDTVTITAKVARPPEDGSIMVYIGGEVANVEIDFVTAHTPAKPPMTYEEFAAMPHFTRKRWFEELAKPKRRTVETWMRENDKEPNAFAESLFFWGIHKYPSTIGKAHLPACVWAEMSSGLFHTPHDLAYDMRESAVSALRDALLKLKLIDE